MFAIRNVLYMCKALHPRRAVAAVFERSRASWSHLEHIRRRFGTEPLIPRLKIELYNCWRRHIGEVFVKS